MLSVCFHVSLRSLTLQTCGLCGAQPRLWNMIVEVGDKGVTSVCRQVRSIPSCQPPGVYTEVTSEFVLVQGYYAL